MRPTPPESWGVAIVGGTARPDLRKRYLRTALGAGLLAAPLLALPLLQGLAGASSGVHGDTNGKITICHATRSETNPYVVNTPNKNGDVSGHDKHNGPIWKAGDKAKGVDWGDIIPRFDYNDNGVTKHYSGKNWNDEGQAIWNNGCKVNGPAPTSTVTQTQTVTVTETVTKTVTQPGSTVTVQGAVVTTTAPGSTVTVTTTAPGPTRTVTTTAPGATVTKTASLAVLGESFSRTPAAAAPPAVSSGLPTAVLGTTVTRAPGSALPFTGAPLPVKLGIVLAAGLLATGAALIASGRRLALGGRHRG